jgi:hypothetical protein
MSFVDLMANDVWSPADIDSRVAQLIRSQYSSDDELKAARLARKADQTPGDVAFVAAVDAWIAQCVQEGSDARADMALLAQVFPMEDAKRRLDQPTVQPEYDEDGNLLNEDAVLQDEAERVEAQEVIDGASSDAKTLFDLRNPPPIETNPSEEI